MKSVPASTLVGAFVLASVSPAWAQEGAYLDHADLTSELRELADGSDQVTLSTIATSSADREVWLLEIADPDGVPVAERSGVLVVGNLDGNHVAGSRLTLDIARYLAGPDEVLEPLLADHVFYLVPRLNPDGAERMFAEVREGGTLNLRPMDEDNDGRTDEDPPEDLNGDGLVTVMRVPDPLGELVPDSSEPRLMVEADPARSRAGGYVLHWEGVDSDGDGFYNEDPSGGVDLDRNFQHEYPYWERGAGPYMVSEPETRGLMDFVLAHRNIAAILTFGQSDNLVSPPDDRGELAPARPLTLHGFADDSNAEALDVGVYSAFSPLGALDLRGAQPGADNDPGSGRRPAVTVNEDDLEYFAAISDLYRDITGIEQVGVTRAAEGAFFQYGYFHYGVPSFSTPGWALPDSEDAPGETEGEVDADGAPDPGPAAVDAAGAQDAADGSGEETEPDEAEAPEAELLAALEGAGLDVFVDWTPFDHPELGEVEIGGFRPYAVANPPAEQLPELGRLHGEFVAELARMLPRVQIASTEVESHGGGLFTVRAEVENTGFLPTALQHGVVAGAVDPVTVRIGVPPGDLVTGDALTSRIDRLEGSGTREEFTWMIRGEEGEAVEIRARSQKGGTDVVSVTLEAP